MTTNPLTCHQWHSRFCKMLYQKLGAPWPSTQPDNMLFGRIQPKSNLKKRSLIDLYQAYRT